MKTLPACTSPTSLLRNLVEDGWSEEDILHFFGLMGYVEEDVWPTLKKARRGELNVLVLPSR